MRVLVLLACLLALTVGLQAQVFPTSVATDANVLAAKNSAVTTLASTITSGTTTIVLSSGALFGNNMVITIEAERIFCTTLTTNTFTGCTRGYDNSANVSHTAGVTVSGFITAAHHNVLANEIKGVEGWLRDGKFNFCSSTTGTDSYACNLSPPITSYTVGARYFILVDTANTGPATLQLNGIASPVTIKKQHDQDLVTGDIEAGNLVEVGYDGTYMQMLSQLASGGAAGLGDPGSNGLLSRINLNQTVNRTLQGTTGNVTVSNGDGVSGNPTLDLGNTAVQTDQGNVYASGLQDFSDVPIRITGGTGVPSGTACDEAGERGSLYARYDNPATNPSKVYACKQTGASSYAWMPIGWNVGTTPPAKCDVGDVFFDSDATAGQNWFGCTAADTWNLLGGSGGGLSDPAGNGIVVRTSLNSTAPRSLQGTAGNVVVTNGDGTGGNPTFDLGTSAVQTDQANTWSVGMQDFSGVPVRVTGGTAAPSATACDEAGERGSLYIRFDNPATNPSAMYICTQTGAATYAWQFSSHKTGTTAPAKCDVGMLFFDSDAPAGQNLYGCTSTDTWQLLGGTGGGGGTPGGSPGDIQVNSAGTFGGANINQNADGTLVASKAVTTPAPSSPTFGTTTTCVLSDSLDCKFTLTSNTTLALQNPHGAGRYAIWATQNGTGNYHITYPMSFRNTCQPSPVANALTLIEFRYDGVSTYLITACSSDNDGVIFHGKTLTYSGTIDSGEMAAWFDTTKANFVAKNAAGDVFETVKGIANPSDNQCVTYIDVNGVQQRSLCGGGGGGGYSGTATLGTSAIGSGACATTTVSQTGVVSTDTVFASFNSDPTGVTGYAPSTDGMLTILPYPTTNNVNFKICNNTGASITPGAITLNWRVAGGAVATGTSALGTSEIASGACASAVTTGATGAVSTSVVAASFNGDVTAVTGYSPSTSGMLTIVAYPTTGNVNFKVCNNTASPITPGAVTLNWRVL